MAQWFRRRAVRVQRTWTAVGRWWFCVDDDESNTRREPPRPPVRENWSFYGNVRTMTDTERACGGRGDGAEVTVAAAASSLARRGASQISRAPPRGRAPKMTVAASRHRRCCSIRVIATIIITVPPSSSKRDRRNIPRRRPPTPSHGILITVATRNNYLNRDTTRAHCPSSNVIHVGRLRPPPNTHPYQSLSPTRIPCSLVWFSGPSYERRLHLYASRRHNNNNKMLHGIIENHSSDFHCLCIFFFFFIFRY